MFRRPTVPSWPAVGSHHTGTACQSLAARWFARRRARGHSAQVCAGGGAHWSWSFRGRVGWSVDRGEKFSCCCCGGGESAEDRITSRSVVIEGVKREERAREREREREREMEGIDCLALSLSSTPARRMRSPFKTDAERSLSLSLSLSHSLLHCSRRNK